MARSIEARDPSRLPVRAGRLWYGRIAVAGGLLLVAAGGCQRGAERDLVPVEGTVTRGGRPLSGIEVAFLPDADTAGPRATSVTDEAGHYSLRTDGGDGGTTVGTYRVRLSDTYRASLPLIGKMTKAAEHSEEARKKVAEFKAVAATVPRVPGRYTRANETPLRAEVRPGSPTDPQVIDFQIP